MWMPRIEGNKISVVTLQEYQFTDCDIWYDAHSYYFRVDFRLL
jgi:hypothetical protein